MTQLHKDQTVNSVDKSVDIPIDNPVDNSIEIPVDNQASKQKDAKPVMDKIDIYTDGACKGNPGRGGWGALLVSKGKEKELFGGEKDTTNNRMELMAVIKALTILKRPCHIILHSDSQYVLKGITEWIDGWKAKGWRTASKAPVKNVDLWQALDQARQVHHIEWKWVKGHSGHIENERADELANRGVDSI